MSANMPDVNQVIDAVKGRTLPAQANMLSLAAIAFGVVGLGYGFGVAGAAWTWGAILVAIVYCLGIAQGGVMFGVIQTGTRGYWGRPLKRVGEALGVFLVPAWLAMVIFLLVGGTTIYAWNPDTIIAGGPVALEPHSAAAWSSKPLWLSKWFFIGRLIVAVGGLVALSLAYIRGSLRPDLIMAKARLGADAPSWWDKIIGGETNLEKAVESGQGIQTKLFALIAWCYAFVFSLVAFDLFMSLDPWWFANMFGGWFFVSSVWLGFAAIGLVSMLGRDWLGLKGILTPTNTHDHGKMLLAFCMFWGYTTYAMLMPIWYTDMPEETSFLLIRLQLPAWAWLSKTVAIMCFLAPFTILLSRGIKKMRYPFAAICALIMTGLFLERSLVVMPSIYLEDTFPFVDFLIVNVGIWLGALGVMTQVVGRFLAQTPGLVISDPKLGDHPWDQHVHSLDHAHH